MDMTEGKCVWLGILQLLPLPGRGKYAGCYLYGIRSGDTDASYGSPLGGRLWHKWYLGSFYPAYFYSAKIMVSLQKREMVIQLMGFYRNFVQIDNG